VPAEEVPPTGLSAEVPVTVAATFCATLVDEWARSGVTDAVVCPGSRSTPLALALAADDRVRVHVHHDERAAGFVALGLGAATGRPAVVLTTSGTAAVELHPAVVEAHHGRVPFIACTADRPPELRDVGAPQTIDQARLFGPAVRWWTDPGVPDDAARHAWRSLAGRAVLAATGSPPGPVQVQLPFREPLVGRPGPLPPGRDGGAPWHRRVGPAAAPGGTDLAPVVALLAGRRGVLVAGGAIVEPEAVLALATTLGWPVLADPRSGCRVPHPAVVAHADAVARAAAEGGLGLEPDVVVRLGSAPASKAVPAWLAEVGATEVVVDAVGDGPDPGRGAAVQVVGEPSAVCAGLARLLAGGSGASGADGGAGEPGAWLRRWRDADDAVAAVLADVVDGGGEASEPAVARAVSAAVADGGTLVVSSSMPVRDVEWFAGAREGLRVLANRGANGIDGVTSTALGVALAGGPVVALVGDVAFLHDANALLGAPTRAADLTVVVVDNDGGGIFSFLPQAAALGDGPFEALFGTPHGIDVAEVARALGVGATVVADLADLGSAVADAQAAGSVHVVVVRTDRRANVAVHAAVHAATAVAVRAALSEVGGNGGKEG
jgi:2-succinyl-5-enolpyruvyl-6-hydroxy-3-cyclohexene-1-carboxylate synthase